ncbi:Fungal-trans domain-containing protein [Mycena chlorophos]|uniref:Fungal-trans domain-containing protein n=1 Tax=Mycena chlorophos TaxID=658473 RepID=A0A8H6S420_MYCCL|nr:Fungal-trans domain-containing protein [Mycena chlorophos]
MSDDEGYYVSPEHSGSSPAMKHKKVERSCDLCRKRKIRCDGPKPDDGAITAGGACAHCIAFGAPCTYLLPTKKRGPKNKQVEELKRQVAALEHRLRTLSDSATSEENAQEEEPDDSEELTRDFNRISVDPKYFGSNSGFALANEAIALVQAKERATGHTSPESSRRPLYSQVLPWEKEVYDQKLQFEYPEPDLLYSLLHLYFTCVHPTLPILHRPSFERNVSEGLHHKDPQFGAMLLSVLAVASRFSDDRRVFVNGHSTLSSGWKFITQIPVVRKWFEPNIHEVQFYFLMTLYSIGTSRPQAAWIYLGNGIRFLQQRGEHRRKRDMEMTDIDREIWSRAFWSFILLDRMVCAYIGRPTAFHVEDYDADPLLEVDDEYWDTGFHQPSDRPAYSSFLICYVQLSEILGDAMRKLYGSKKSKNLQGWNGREWEQRAVASLDSDMNKIFDSLPPHLRWDPDRKPRDAFYDQSFVLYITYYYTQIVVHRPYIQKVSVVAAPSLSICASAARSILHATDAWMQRQQRLLMQFCVSPMFVSSVILIMNSFGKRPGPAVDKDKALVSRGMEIMKFCEARLHPQGRLWEMLNRLQSADGPLFKQRTMNTPQMKTPATAPYKSHGPSLPSASPIMHSAPVYGDLYGEMHSSKGPRPPAPSLSPPTASEMYPSVNEGQPHERVVAHPPPQQRWHHESPPAAHMAVANAQGMMSQPYDMQSAMQPAIHDMQPPQSIAVPELPPGMPVQQGMYMQPGVSIEEMLAQTPTIAGYTHHQQQHHPHEQQQQQHHQQPHNHEYMQQMHVAYFQDEDMALEDADYVMWNSAPENLLDVGQWAGYMQRNSSASPPSSTGYGHGGTPPNTTGYGHHSGGNSPSSAYGGGGPTNGAHYVRNY